MHPASSMKQSNSKASQPASQPASKLLSKQRGGADRPKGEAKRGEGKQIIFTAKRNSRKLREQTAKPRVRTHCFLGFFSFVIFLGLVSVRRNPLSLDFLARTLQPTSSKPLGEPRQVAMALASACQRKHRLMLRQALAWAACFTIDPKKQE